MVEEKMVLERVHRRAAGRKREGERAIYPGQS